MKLKDNGVQNPVTRTLTHTWTLGAEMNNEIPIGQRNKNLFRGLCLNMAARNYTHEALLDAARQMNRDWFIEPLPDNEVEAMVNNIFTKYSRVGA